MGGYVLANQGPRLAMPVVQILGMCRNGDLPART